MAKSTRSFNAQAFLDSAGPSKKIVAYRRAEVVYSQGDPCESVMYIQQGGVKLSARSSTGKEAVVAILGPGDFFGEGCLAGQAIRTRRATAITPSTVLEIDKHRMVKVLGEQLALSARFIANTLSRHVRIERDLIDHLFDSSERRLARALLLLAGYHKRHKSHQVVPTVSQATLADMAGTTGPRVGFFLNKFKNLGFIAYEDDLAAGIQVNSSLLRVVLHG